MESAEIIRALTEIADKRELFADSKAGFDAWMLNHDARELIERLLRENTAMRGVVDAARRLSVMYRQTNDDGLSVVMMQAKKFDRVAQALQTLDATRSTTKGVNDEA